MSAPPIGKSALPKRPAIMRRPQFPRGQIVLQAMASLVLLAVAWELVAKFAGVSPLYLPSFTAVLEEFLAMQHEGVLLPNVMVSLGVYGSGMATSILLAVPLGLAVGAIPVLSRALSPYLWALYTTPSVIIMPLVLLWVGINDAARVLLVVVEALPAITVVVMAGVKTVEGDLLDMARSFSATRLSLFRQVVFPSTLPYIGTGIRMGVTRGLIGLFVGELFTSTDGIGYILSLAQSQFNTARTFAIILLFVMFSVSLVYLSRLIQQRLSDRGG